ncbi:hypothetical protein KBZ18_05325 [Synechococcus sp. Cruz-9H2]|jgi:hypothetical protein|uniref:hypothetical protein n=1 Tax=unclassified Synechococcus TaxID=2626047 RepID=UPI0020CE1039|nr:MULTISPECIES: hypothetical protein [unclassified Synechococcus]MCP9818910.1 hypothetical protein [Synechococcus sp. Cruz-9H2]MCP9843414.1 hypothetical protein [Synechococcus sp. Edmonson 11F2]MCP9855204.1 hypothetical protein [Synechococcus sp. Cruz-9C9]MCP9862824.1 hypothetical protein [Synechococcus sp. Cruz-7E5]MCP9869820.1 hypothetical protein [Synechococcus sp. Cruz-7B9]
MSFIRNAQLVLMPPAAAALAMLLQVGSGQAQTGPSRLQLTPNQKSELFKGQRTLSLRAHTDQIAILRKGERCLNEAKDLEALSACRQTERQARRELMSRTREEARALHQRLGLPAPQGRRGKGGPGGWGDPADQI